MYLYANDLEREQTHYFLTCNKVRTSRFGYKYITSRFVDRYVGSVAKGSWSGGYLR